MSGRDVESETVKGANGHSGAKGANGHSGAKSGKSAEGTAGGKSGKSAEGAKLADRLPWRDKYRPRSLADVVGNGAAMDRLRALSTSALPISHHLLLAGPPGTGKSTTLACLARALLGPSFANCALELDASMAEGADLMRESVLPFLQRTARPPPNRAKLVLLDEADCLTSDAQHLLRRAMQDHASTAFFFMACNEPDSLMPAVRSQCAEVCFTRVADADVAVRLADVARLESVACPDDAMRALVFVAHGDMRTALGALQISAAFAGPGVELSSELVYRIAEVAHPQVVREAVAQCAAGDIGRAVALVGGLWAQGYCAADVADSMFRIAKCAEPALLSDVLKARFLQEITLLLARISEGLDTRLQLNGLLARLCSAALAYSAARAAASRPAVLAMAAGSSTVDDCDRDPAIARLRCFKRPIAIANAAHVSPFYVAPTVAGAAAGGAVATRAGLGVGSALGPGPGAGAGAGPGLGTGPGAGAGAGSGSARRAGLGT